MKLNQIHLDRFKLYGDRYLIPVRNGLFLSFDKYSLEYNGVEMFYNQDFLKVNKLIEEVLNNLISKDFILVD